MADYRMLNLVVVFLFVEEITNGIKSAFYRMFNFDRQVNWAMKDNKNDSKPAYSKLLTTLFKNHQF